MCQIIPLTAPGQIKENPLLLPPQRIVKAAWYFACAALWSGQIFSKPERKRSQRQIAKLLGHGDSTATITFYERILLERSRLQTELSAYLPARSTWLHPDYPQGYKATAMLHHDHLTNRPIIPFYHEQIRALANGYFQFIQRPGHFNFSCCQNLLRDLKAFSLLQIFYEAAACNS